MILDEDLEKAAVKEAYDLVKGGKTKEGVELFMMLAEEDNPDALYVLGELYAFGWITGSEDWEKANFCFARAGELGHKKALYEYGRNICFGIATKQDEKEGVALIQRSAESGYTPAMIEIGDRYKDGEGVKKDYHYAEYFYKKAAEKGDIEAHKALGYFYSEEDESLIRPKDAFYHYLVAAEAGEVESMRKLGEFYLEGFGVDIDIYEGARYLFKAAYRGDEEAKEMIEEDSALSIICAMEKFEEDER